MGENIAGCKNLNPEVIRPLENPYLETGGIAVLRGNLAPDGSVVKRSAVLPEMLVHEGPAKVFASEEEAQKAINAGKSSTVKAVVNELYDSGLRILEVRKEQLHAIPKILDELTENPLKFILFIDDLSFTKDHAENLMHRQRNLH